MKRGAEAVDADTDAAPSKQRVKEMAAARTQPGLRLVVCAGISTNPLNPPIPRYPQCTHHQYFQVRARAEAARMIMAFGGIDYTDEVRPVHYHTSPHPQPLSLTHRLTHPSTYPSIQPPTAQDCQSYFGKSFQECKKELGLLPFGQLPLLEVDVDGTKTLLAQSGSINRFLAKLANCAPEEPLAAAQCDMYHELALELSPVNPVVNIFRGQIWEEKKAHFFDDILPARLPRLAMELGDKVDDLPASPTSPTGLFNLY